MPEMARNVGSQGYITRVAQENLADTWVALVLDRDQRGRRVRRSPRGVGCGGGVVGPAVTMRPCRKTRRGDGRKCTLGKETDEFWRFGEIPHFFLLPQGKVDRVEHEEIFVDLRCLDWGLISGQGRGRVIQVHVLYDFEASLGLGLLSTFGLFNDPEFD
jgi:hypothetical protein